MADSRAMAAWSLPQIGDLLSSKYRIERLIGEGGMGAVFQARHEKLGHPVALKFLLPSLAKDSQAAARFMNEARAAAQIQSSHVAKVLDVDSTPDGGAYMVIEYLEGADFSRILEQRGSIPVAEAAGYLLETCEALAHAHRLGVIHRDLKPANLFLAQSVDGRAVVKVLDFGISKASGLASGITATSSLLGSPVFMSPEQVRSSKNVDARADIWSLGVIFYNLLTGALPFVGENFGEVFAAVLERTPAPASSLRPDLPREVDEVIGMCLMRERDHRFANVADLADRLAPLAPAEGRPIAEAVRRIVTSARAISPSAPQVDPTCMKVPVTRLPKSPSGGSASAPVFHGAQSHGAVQRIVIRHLSGSKVSELAAFPADREGGISFGLSPAASVVFNPDQDPGVGGVHARIERDPETKEFVLVDPGSRSGVSVNSAKINSRASLRHGDVVQLGDGGPEFLFELDPPPASARPIALSTGMRQPQLPSPPLAPSMPPPSMAPIPGMSGTALPGVYCPAGGTGAPAAREPQGRRKYLVLAVLLLLVGVAAGAGVWLMLKERKGVRDSMDLIPTPAGVGTAPTIPGPPPSPEVATSPTAKPAKAPLPLAEPRASPEPMAAKASSAVTSVQEPALTGKERELDPPRRRAAHRKRALERVDQAEVAGSNERSEPTPLPPPLPASGHVVPAPPNPAVAQEKMLEGTAETDRHLFKKRVILINKSKTPWTKCGLRLNDGRVRKGVDLAAGKKIWFYLSDFEAPARAREVELKVVDVRCAEGSATFPLH